MRIIDFSFFDITEPHDDKYNNWSRKYEYPWVLNRLSAYGVKNVHNTSCGGSMDVHRQFAEELSKYYDTVHSDIDSTWGGRIYYDVTKPYTQEKFDAVLNISAIEHIENAKPIEIINNLLSGVISGGVILITFDYPTVNLEELENDIGVKCLRASNPVTREEDGLQIIRLEIVR